jgi:hypothetical protein
MLATMQWPTSYRRGESAIESGGVQKVLSGGRRVLVFIGDSDIVSARSFPLRKSLASLCVPAAGVLRQRAIKCLRGSISNHRTRDGHYRH